MYYSPALHLIHMRHWLSLNLELVSSLAANSVTADHNAGVKGTCVLMPTLHIGAEDLHPGPNANALSNLTQLSHLLCTLKAV